MVSYLVFIGLALGVAQATMIPDFDQYACLSITPSTQYKPGSPFCYQNGDCEIWLRIIKKLI